MPLATLHATCIEILNRYRADPWQWAREIDLVVDVVSLARAGLPQPVVDGTLVGDGFVANRLIDTVRAPRRIPRVRTEVKIGNRERVDICVLAERPVHVFMSRVGARDILLTVREQDVAGLLEVKFYSDLYIDKGRYCMWLDDLLKLSRFTKEAVRGVLYVDTGLPLATVGVNYLQKRGERSLERRHEALPPWPLPAESDFEVRYVDRDASVQVVKFEPVPEPDGLGLFLWAFGARTWRPHFVSQQSPPLPVGNVVPSCWKVSVDPVDSAP